MNRLEEYEALIKELEQPSEKLENTLQRAKKKRNHRKYLIRPLTSAAAVFFLFVLLVNFSSTAAYACAQVPILRELAEAVKFSHSLTKAVENEYVQTIDLVQKQGEITAKVEYLIVDQKQVNVFYRLYSDQYEQLTADPRIYAADGSDPQPCSYHSDSIDKKNGELRSVTIDFWNSNVPEALNLKLMVRDTSINTDAEPAVLVEDAYFMEKESETAYLAELEFLLEFDPTYTAEGRKISVNKTVELEGQEITITDVEIYPTQLRMNVIEGEENTAELQSLYFYLLTEKGEKFDPVAEGVTSAQYGNEISYIADSTWFYDARSIQLVITGAEWLKNDMKKVYVNLETCEAKGFPEGIELCLAEEKEGGWIVRVKAKRRKADHFHQIMDQVFYDMEGTEYLIDSWSSMILEEETENDCFAEEFALKDYHEKEVYLCPHYSHEWTAEKPVTIVIK